MIERVISASDRDPFFAWFSSAHLGAPVTVRMAARTAVSHQPFRGVSVDGPDLIVHTGFGVDEPQPHRVDRVAAVRLEQTDEGADAALVLMSDDGTCTEVRFRWPMQADLLDPAVE
jgi:hypothetical protein